MTVTESRGMRRRGGASVPCPECGGDSRVVETRRVDDMTVRRTRACQTCDHRFETRETIRIRRRGD